MESDCDKSYDTLHTLLRGSLLHSQRKVFYTPALAFPRTLHSSTWRCDMCRMLLLRAQDRLPSQRVTAEFRTAETEKAELAQTLETAERKTREAMQLRKTICISERVRI